MAKLFYRHGTMCSGKSIEIIKIADSYTRQGKNVILLTPSINDRDGVGKIASRMGLQIDGLIIYPDTNILKLVSLNHIIKSLDCVLIDEVQFLKKEQVIQLANIVDELDIPVIGYGLKNTTRNDLFEGSYNMLVYANKIEEVKTTCKFCNKKATMNLLTENGIPKYDAPQIIVEHFDDKVLEFHPVCSIHYKNPPTEK